jgi:hypothetical protein
MKVVKDSYISINFYFAENIQSQMTKTPIKYFKGELMHVLQAMFLVIFKSPLSEII